MMPRLGSDYDVEIEVISMPIAEYQCDEYFERDLPAAPAIMLGDEIVVEGSDITENSLRACICRKLGLPEPQRKSFISRLLGG